MTIEVLVEDDPRCDPADVQAAAQHAMDALHVHPAAELCIRFVEPAAIEVLHEQWMDLAGPTDVMSFPMDELRPGKVNEEPEEGVLGDLVLAPSVAERQGVEAGHGPHRDDPVEEFAPEIIGRRGHGAGDAGQIARGADLADVHRRVQDAVTTTDQQLGTTLPRTGTVCSPIGEYLVSEDGWRCPIDTIEEVEDLDTARALVEARALAEADAEAAEAGY